MCFYIFSTLRNKKIYLNCTQKNYLQIWKYIVYSVLKRNYSIFEFNIHDVIFKIDVIILECETNFCEI